MAIHRNSSMVIASLPFILPFLFFIHLRLTEAEIGVCNGMLGNNLPCAQDVVDLYESNGIGAMRLYKPDQDTLQSLQETNIKLMLGVANEDIIPIANDQSTADDWVATNVVDYAQSIKYIAVGNEIHPSDEQASSLECAMQNIQNSLDSLVDQSQFESQIKVSTAIDTGLITNSSPPSNSTFRDLSYMTPIINFLTKYDAPLLVNIQPYNAYINDEKIPLDYALFTAKTTAFTDPKTGKNYQNLFDAIYDAVYLAVEKVIASQNNNINNSLYEGSKKKSVGNGYSPKLAASESEWSSKGGFPSRKRNRRMTSGCDPTTQQQKGCGGASSSSRIEAAATVENAKTFYKNMIQHVKKGTPLTEGQEIEVYLFAMFDENLKPGDESERHYGLFTPEGYPKYGQLCFSN